MQQTSALYKELLAGDYTVETRVAIGDSGLLVEKTGDHITFGGTRILIATSGADGGYGANMLSSVETSGGLFDGDEPSCGNCISREVNIKMLKPIGQIPGLSRVGIYARITDGTRASEWLPQGVFFIDSIEEDAEDDDVRWLRIHGYDALLFSEQDYPSNTNLTWPAKDIDVVREIASALGVTVDKRTKNAMKNRRLKASMQAATAATCTAATI